MWACAAISNLIQNDPATRRLLQGKNIVGALIARLTDSVEDVVVESCGALRSVADPPCSPQLPRLGSWTLTFACSFARLPAPQEPLHRRRLRPVRRDLQQGRPVAPRGPHPAGASPSRGLPDEEPAASAADLQPLLCVRSLQITSTLNGIFTSAPLDVKKDLVEIRKRKLVYDLSENVLTILWCLSCVPLLRRLPPYPRLQPC